MLSLMLQSHTLFFLAPLDSDLLPQSTQKENFVQKK